MANTKVTSRVLADDAVGLAQLNISNDPSNGQALTYVQSSNDLQWATVGVTGIDSSADATAITIDSSENVAVTGNLSAAKLTSNNGVLELDDNGSHNGIINVPASLSINIDSDNGATTESFSIAKDKTGINDTDVLFRVKEDGKVGVGTLGTSWHFSTDSTNQYLASFDGSNNTGVVINGDASQASIIGYSSSASNYNAIDIRAKTGAGSGVYLRTDGRVCIGDTSNNTNAKLLIQSSDGVPLTIGSDQYGGSGTTTWFTESIEGKSATNTHTITIAFTSQASRWTTHAVELTFAGSRDNATTPYINRSLYGFTSLTSIANITEAEDTGVNTSCTASSSGLNFTMTVSASSVASYQVCVKVTSSFGNARPTSITVT